MNGDDLSGVSQRSGGGRRPEESAASPRRQRKLLPKMTSEAAKRRFGFDLDRGGQTTRHLSGGALLAPHLKRDDPHVDRHFH